MDFNTFFNSRFFQGLTVLTNLMIVNVLFVVSTIVTTGILSIPALVALFAISADILEGRDNHLFRKYFTHFKGAIVFGLIMTAILIPLGTLTYLNYRFIQAFYELNNQRFITMVMLSFQTFIVVFFALIATQMLLWQSRYKNTPFRKTFIYSFTIVMTGIKEILMMIVLIVFIAFLGLLLPYLFFIILFSLFTFLATVIYQKRYRVIAEGMAKTQEAPHSDHN